MAEGYALVGYVFQNVSLPRALSCYQTCQSSCRCISFNFLTNVNQDNCQLNEENRHLKPGALIPMEGSQYYDLVMEYSVKVGRIHWRGEGGEGRRREGRRERGCLLS